MNRYRGKKKHKQIKKREPATHQAAQATECIKTKGKDLRKPLALLFLFGFLLYANTIPFEHALDDKLAITHNQFTKQGIKGIPDICSNDLLVGFYGKKRNLLAGSRYRPLSLITFAVEWSLFGPAPGITDPEILESKLNSLAHVSHFVNALLYGLTGVVLFLVLMRLFPYEQEKKWFLSLPFAATALYLAHPLHTEVIANIKSRDEIMSVLASLAALLYLLRYLSQGKKSHLLLSSCFFLLGLFSKETAITFLGIIPLSVYFFTPTSFKTLFRACVPLGIGAALYIGIRYAVVGSGQLHPVPELLNDPYLYANSSEKLASIFYTMGLYLKLLFFPHPLTHDYYPWHPLLQGHFTWGHFPYLHWSDPGVLFSFIIYMTLIVIGLKGIRKKKFLSFCILQFMLSFLLFSNLFFSIGTFMNERFMYVPSIGFCIFIAWFLVKKMARRIRSTSMIQALFVALLLAYSIQTISRNNAWKNDYTLSTTDVQTSQNSAKVNMSAGLALVHQVETDPEISDKENILRQAVQYLNHSLELYPNYIQSLVVLGSAYYLLDDYKQAYTYLKRALKVNYKFRDARKNMYRLGMQCEEKQLNRLAADCYETILKYYPEDIKVLGALGKVYARGLGKPEQAIAYLNKAHQLDPKNTDIIQKIGVVYATTGHAEEAIEMFQKGLDINPGNAHIIMNIGIAYKSLGKDSLGQAYLDRAFELDPSLKQ